MKTLARHQDVINYLTTRNVKHKVWCSGGKRVSIEVNGEEVWTGAPGEAWGDTTIDINKLNTMNKLATPYKAAMRSIFGYEFMVWHDDADGSRKVFHCETLQDAMEWASCALNCSAVKVIDRSGYLVCQRFPVA